MSPTVKETETAPSVSTSLMIDMVGASFTALTVTKKYSLVDSVPSLTVTVMVADPDSLSAGVTVTVRLASLPPKTMFPLGTTVVSDETALKIRLPVDVSTSPMLKPNAPVELSSSMA